MWHRLTEVNVDTKRAICSVCGPVTITMRNRTSAGNIVWRCYSTRKNKGKHAYRKHKGSQCENKICPYNADHPSLLDVHHIDNNSKNHDPENLITLCAHCHRLVTYKVSKLKRHRSGWRLHRSM